MTSNSLLKQNRHGINIINYLYLKKAVESSFVDTVYEITKTSAKAFFNLPFLSIPYLSEFQCN